MAAKADASNAASSGAAAGTDAGAGAGAGADASKVARACALVDTRASSAKAQKCWKTMEDRVALKVVPVVASSASDDNAPVDRVMVATKPFRKGRKSFSHRVRPLCRGGIFFACRPCICRRGIRQIHHIRPLPALSRPAHECLKRAVETIPGRASSGHLYPSHHLSQWRCLWRDQENDKDAAELLQCVREHTMLSKLYLLNVKSYWQSGRKCRIICRFQDWRMTRGGASQYSRARLLQTFCGRTA